MKILSIILLLIPSMVQADFSFYAGLSLSDEKGAKPEIDLPDPLGILRLEYETEKETIIFCEHISSFPKTEIGKGLGHCGFMIKL